MCRNPGPFATASIAVKKTLNSSLLPPIVAVVMMVVLAALDIWIDSIDQSAWTETAHHENEVAICRKLAPKYNAECEHKLDDGTRVDLLNQDYAIEVDWAKPPKIYEAVGQSLYYGIKTKRKPAIILLVRNEALETKYITRCRTVCDQVGITLWLEDVPSER